MSELNYETVDQELIKSLPEIREPYEEELKSWTGEEPGQHNIFGNVLNPFLLDLLQKDSNEGLIKRAFDFIEQMATSNDEKVSNVVQVTICEQLGDDKIILEKARKYMGQKTLELSKDAEKFLGRES